MDENFNNNINPDQAPVPEENPAQNNFDSQFAQNNQKPDYSAQYAQYNQPKNFQSQGYEPYQPQDNLQQGYQPYQPQDNTQQGYQPYQPQDNAQQGYQPYQQPGFDQYQNNPVQPYDYNNNGYNQQQYQVPNYDAVPQNNAKGFAIASLVLGICSFFCCGIILGVLGLIFGIVSRNKQKENNGMATAGIVLSVTGLALTVFFLIFSIVTGKGIYQIYNNMLSL